MVKNRHLQVKIGSKRATNGLFEGKYQPKGSTIGIFKVKLPKYGQTRHFQGEDACHTLIILTPNGILLTICTSKSSQGASQGDAARQRRPFAGRQASPTTALVPQGHQRVV